MPKVLVKLLHVKCHVTEDDTGADEIYVVAGHASSLANLTAGQTIDVKRFPKLQPVPSPSGVIGFKRPTRSMNNGDSWSPDTVILEADIGYGPLEVAVWLFDQDAAETIDKDEVAAVAEAVNAAGEGLAPVTEGKSKLAALAAEFLIRLIAGLVELDEDDLLGMGQFAINLPPPGPQLSPLDPAYDLLKSIRRSIFTTHVRRFEALEDGARYEVYYSVTLSE